MDGRKMNAGYITQDKHQRVQIQKKKASNSLSRIERYLPSLNPSHVLAHLLGPWYRGGTYLIHKTFPAFRNHEEISQVPLRKMLTFRRFREKFR